MDASEHFFNIYLLYKIAPLSVIFHVSDKTSVANIAALSVILYVSHKISVGNIAWLSVQ